jgi:hypothetical protein
MTLHSSRRLMGLAMTLGFAALLLTAAPKTPASATRQAQSLTV